MTMKILLMDIETAPNVAHVWGLWQQNIAINQIQASGYVMCFAAKWAGKRGVVFDSVNRSSQKHMLKQIHDLLNEADAVVHYNGTSFDIPTLNKEFLQLSMPPPAPYKQIDLLVVARKQFRFPSNKLDYVLKALGFPGKVRHKGHEMWIQCMAGNEAAWRKMEQYNIGDVTKLEKVYNRMLPWIPNHPNHGIYLNEVRPVCTNCGGSHLQRRGITRTASQVYARFQCNDCHTWNRGAVGELPRGSGKKLMRQVQV